MTQPLSGFFSTRKRIFFLTVLSVGCFCLLTYFANVGLSQNATQSDALQNDAKQLNDAKVNENPHWLVGSYYTVQNGIEAKLLLNNKGPRPIEVRPTLYSSSGQTLEIAPVIVESNSHRFINLADWAALGGESFRSGSIKLFHTGKDLVLGAQIYLTDEAHSLNFEEKLAELGKFDSRRQETVWFQPTNQTETQIVLSNTSDAPLSITARLSKRPQYTGDVNTFQLAAHETRVLDLRRDFSDGNQFANADIVGLSLEHAGTKSALQARVLIRDAGRGYSNFAQFSNPAGGKSNEYQGVGFQIDEIEGNQLEPVVIARNVGAETANVSVEIPYTRTDGTSGIVRLPTVNLQAGEIRSFNMKRVAQVTRREQIEIAGIEVKYDTAPGSVVVAAHSADRDNNLVFRVPMWDPLQQKSPTGGYPWRIEETSTTKTYIKNTTDQEEDYVAFLLWENGGEYMIGRKTIAAHKTIEIDVKQLRDEQIPDFRGRTIPLNVQYGQLQWTLKRIDSLPDDDQRANLALIGRSEQIDLINKTSSNYACQNCCESSASGYVTSDPFGYKYDSYEFEVGDVVQFYAFEEIWTCYQTPGEPPQIYPRNSNNWSSNNSNVATVTSSGLVTIQGAGEVEIGTNFWVSFSFSNGECPPGPYLTECRDDKSPKTETDELTKTEAKETNKAELLLPE